MDGTSSHKEYRWANGARYVGEWRDEQMLGCSLLARLTCAVSRETRVLTASSEPDLDGPECSLETQLMDSPENAWPFSEQAMTAERM